MSAQFFVSDGGKVGGPYSIEKIRAAQAAGKLSALATIATDKAGPWKALQPQPTNPQPQPITQPTAATEQRETHLWGGCPSQWSNAKTFFWCGLFCWLIFPVFIAIWRWLQVFNTRYNLTSERLTIKRGIIAQQIEALELYRIKDVTLSQSVFERLTRTATLTLKTSDHTTPVVVVGPIRAAAAKTLSNQIRTFTEIQRDKKRVREFD